MFSSLVLLLLDTTHQLQVSPKFYYFRRYMSVEGLGCVRVVAIKGLTGNYCHMVIEHPMVIAMTRLTGAEYELCIVRTGKW